MTFDPTKIRPTKNWCIILEDKISPYVGGGLIVRPGGSLKEEKLSEGTGTLVRVGVSEKTKVMGLEPGQKVVFRGYLKHANPVETDEVWEMTLQELQPVKKKYFFMSCDDIVGLIPPGMVVGVFSSPASHAIPAGAFDAPKKGK